MAAKLAAARIAAAAGIHLAIADGRVLNPMTRFAATGRGTVFVAGEGARAKKAWLAGRLTVAGTLTVERAADIARLPQREQVEAMAAPAPKVKTATKKPAAAAGFGSIGRSRCAARSAEHFGTDRLLTSC